MSICHFLLGAHGLNPLTKRHHSINTALAPVLSVCTSVFIQPLTMGVIYHMCLFVSAADICRVCRSEGTPDKPLYHPCVCTGSIKFIHQEW